MINVQHSASVKFRSLKRDIHDGNTEKQSFENLRGHLDRNPALKDQTC